MLFRSNKKRRAKNITIYLEIFLKVLFPKPTDLLIGRPELAGLINIDLTGLLSIGLSELFANAKGFDASLEDPSLTAQVCGTREAKGGGEVDFSLMKKMPVRVVGEIKHLTLPVSLERLAVAFRQVDGR